MKRFRVAGYRQKHSPVVIDEIMRPGTAVYSPGGGTFTTAWDLESRRLSQWPSFQIGEKHKTEMMLY